MHCTLYNVHLKEKNQTVEREKDKSCTFEGEVEGGEVYCTLNNVQSKDTSCIVEGEKNNSCTFEGGGLEEEEKCIVYCTMNR